MNDKISVVLLTRNEEPVVGDCLRSVAFADEIVVVDSGSTDRTVALCRKHGARVYHRAWTGFGEQRDWAVRKTRYPWVLSMDADERVTPELAREIRETVGREGEVRAYRIPFRNIFLGRWLAHGGMSPDTHLRLFHKRYGRFNHNSIHEWVELRCPEAELTGAIRHLVSRDLAHLVEKHNRYTDTEAGILRRHGVVPTGYDLFLKPVIRFFNAYVSRQGWRDGVPGFLHAFLKGVYFFLIYLKLYERRGWNPSPGRMLLTVFKRNRTGSHGYPSQAFSRRQ